MRPRLLDLFCGAGGAGMGYHRAGFDVVGIDLAPQPNYPFPFLQADALQALAAGFWRSFDAIHASPPCQAYSRLARLHPDRDYPDLVGPTRDALAATGLPYVIENVTEAPLRDPILLCGSMFDPPLDVRRHRGFETNWGLIDPIWPCRHKLWTPRFRSLDKRQKTLASIVGVHGHLNYAGERELRERAMGIDWMTPDELREAIPPAYTELIGHQLRLALRGPGADTAEDAA